MSLKKSYHDIAKECYAILVAIYGKAPWTKEQIASTLAQGGTWHHYLIRRGETELCAFIIYKEIADELEVFYLAVRPDCQGQGRATKLIKEMLKKGKPTYLEVRASNRKAQAVYEKAGFQRISVRKGYYKNPVEDAILMKHEGK